MHTIAWAAAVEIDLVVPHFRADAGRTCQMRGVTATELQCHRMLFGIEPEQARPITTQDRAGGDHLRI